MSEQRCVLPLPPSDNHSHVLTWTAGAPVRRRTRATRRWQAQAAVVLTAWARQAGWTVPPAGTWVVLDVWVWWPDQRRRDAGNLLKVLDDACIGAIVTDDRWLLPRIQGVAVDRAAPRVEVAPRVAAAESSPGGG
jgi:crossover junction endodeoxyribonuclease RusA